MTFKRRKTITLPDVSIVQYELTALGISLLNNESHKDNFSIDIYDESNSMHIVVDGDALLAAIAELLSDDNVN